MGNIDMDDMVARWDVLHAAPDFSPRYPSEAVIRWTFRNFQRDQPAAFDLLDVGAGTGRHSMFWARHGYGVTATDASTSAISETNQWAHQENLQLAAHVAEAGALPFEDGRFDGVLSFGVLYYLSFEGMQRAIMEMWRVLKPGGVAFVMLKSDRDSRCLQATKIGTHSYQVAKPENGENWSAETDMVLTFLDRTAVETCFSAFSKVTIDSSCVTSGGGRFVDDDWLIQLKK